MAMINLHLLVLRFTLELMDMLGISLGFILEFRIVRLLVSYEDTLMLLQHLNNSLVSYDLIEVGRLE